MIIYVYEIDSRSTISINKIDSLYEIEFQQESYDNKLFSDLWSIYDIIDRSVIDSYDSDGKIDRVINMTVSIDGYVGPEDLFFLVEYVF
jgi:hypothetical protein